MSEILQFPGYKESEEYQRVKWLCADQYNRSKDRLNKNPSDLFGFHTRVIKKVENSYKAYQQHKWALIEFIENLIENEDYKRGYVSVSEDKEEYYFEVLVSRAEDLEISSTKDDKVLYKSWDIKNPHQNYRPNLKK